MRWVTLAGVLCMGCTLHSEDGPPTPTTRCGDGQRSPGELCFSERRYPTGPNVHSSANPGVKLGDLDGDGDRDVVYSSMTALVARLNDGSGGLGEERNLTGSVDDFQLADLDRDGAVDLALTNRDLASWQRNEGGLTFARQTNIFTITLPSGGPRLAAGDIEPDGDIDLVLRTGGIDVLFNQGDGQFIPSGVGPSPGFDQNVALADMDVDGDLDLLMGTAVLRNQGGSFAFTPLVRPAFSRLPPSVVDWDNDGLLDLVWTDQSEVQVLISTATDQRFSCFGRCVVTLAAADLDGDGLTDLALVEDAPPFRLLARRRVGLRSFDDLVLTDQLDRPEMGGFASLVQVVELNGDDRPDIILSQPSGLAIWTSTD